MGDKQDDLSNYSLNKVATSLCLQKAIQNIEQFTLTSKASLKSQFHNLEISNGQIKNIKKGKLSLIKLSISSIFSKKKREIEEQRLKKIEEKLLNSIDVVKTHYFFLDQVQLSEESFLKLFNRGKEKDLTLAIVEKYNKIISMFEPGHVNPYSFSWIKKVKKFLLSKMGWEEKREILHSKISIKHPSVSLGEKKVKTFFPNFDFFTSGELPTIKEKDAFRMKGFSLLRKQGIPDVSVKNTLQSFRDAPIKSTSIEKDGKKVALHQVFSPFPGEIVYVEGAFSRNLKGKISSIPIKESFSVVSQAKQTGFPHASQHTGWALADFLIVNFPHRLNRMSLFKISHEKKLKVGELLLPRGSRNLKAKHLLKWRREVFKENLSDFFALHKKFFIQFLDKARCEFPLDGVFEEILERSRGKVFEGNLDRFFQVVKQNENPFDFFSEVNSFIMEKNVKEPFLRLYKELIEAKEESFDKEKEKEDGEGRDGEKREKERRLEKAQSFLLLDWQSTQKRNTEDLRAIFSDRFKAIEDTQKRDYLRSLESYCSVVGSVIGRVSHAIILQQLSEKFVFTPPNLTLFEKRVQASAYQQLFSFHEEILDITYPYSSKCASLVKERFYELLENDIEIFSVSSFSEFPLSLQKIVIEIEEYYKNRNLRDEVKL